MRRSLALALAFGTGFAACWLGNNVEPRKSPAKRPPVVGRAERITVGRPDPSAPSGRAFHVLRPVPPRPLAPDENLTDEWLITVLTNAPDGELAAVTYTAK